MARRLLYTHDVIRRRLSLQLTLVMLLVALVPLAGAGYLTLSLIERSILDQVRANHEQMTTTSDLHCFPFRCYRLDTANCGRNAHSANRGTPQT